MGGIDGNFDAVDGLSSPFFSVWFQDLTSVCEVDED
jgi:hypothetical protein